MKKIITINWVLILYSVLLYSCDKTYITDEKLTKQEPYKYSVKSSKVLMNNGSLEFIAKDVGGGTNYYFRNNNSIEFFLFITCDLDCNEFIEKKEWDLKSNSFAILIKSKYKTNFKTKNRLIFYKVENQKPVELLDTVKDVYKTFRFEDKKFIYTLEDGSEKTINLN